MSQLQQHQKPAQRLQSASIKKPVATSAGQHSSISSLVQIQRSAQSTDLTPPLDTSTVQRTIASDGQPLDDSNRTLMEQRLGFDFSSVRLHTNSDAARSASLLNARAYTLGRHIVFAAGEYCPGTADGKRLLAHELVHSAQQHFADPRGQAHNPAIDDAGSHAEAQARQLSRYAIGSQSAPIVDHGVSQTSSVGSVIQREKDKTTLFNLSESGVGKLIVRKLKLITIGGSDSKKPKVNPDDVIAALSASSSFLKIAATVEKKYFADKEKPTMTLRFHEDIDTGSHFRHAQSLMEIFIPDSQPLSEVTRGIAHEMVHASRGSPAPEGNKKHGKITRLVTGGISDEVKTRQTEREIIEQTPGATKSDLPKQDAKQVSASFVSGKPKLTYQQYFIFNAARESLESALGSNIAKLAKTAASGMLDTKMMEAATTENLKYFQFGRKEIERHEKLKDKPDRDLTKSAIKDPQTLAAAKNEDEQRRKLSKSFYTYYESLQQLNDDKKTKKGLQYLAILLLENRMDKSWKDKDKADDETRQVHIDLLKGILGSKLKGIKL